MRAIGIRELRQHASRYLRDVQRGETIEVTDRGRPVARLVPIPVVTVIEDLTATGRLAPPRGDLAGLGSPLAPANGAALPSDVLGDLRADER